MDLDLVRGCENKMKNNYKYYNRDTRKYLEFPELDHVIEYAEKYRHAANRDIDVLDKM